MRSKFYRFSDFRTSRCVSHFAAFFIGSRAKASTVVTDKKDIQPKLEPWLAVENADRQPPKWCDQGSRRKNASTLQKEEIGNIRANDPSAGSPTETLLRLLLPLNDKVHSSSHIATRIWTRHGPKYSPDHSIGRSDGRCVQRAGT